MPSTVTVFYPQPAEGEFFNMDYYINTHMPIANKHWIPLGLKNWEVAQFGPDAPFHVVSSLTFEKDEDAEIILTKEESKIVVGDVPNFTNLKPILSTGSITGSWVKK